MPPVNVTGFYTDGRDLYDPTGSTVLLRGVNVMSVWDVDDPDGLKAFPEISKAGANAVRIVWLKERAPGNPTDSAALDTLIANARDCNLIPIIELHDATGDWARLDSLVDYWVQPCILDLIHKHEAYLVINVGNEVGDEKVTSADFLAGYTVAVQRMRTEGIHTLLMIDAPGYGKNLEVLNDTAWDLIAADPDNNLIFSVHAYWPEYCYSAADVQNRLQAAVAVGYPLIVGEFGPLGGDPRECSDLQVDICDPLSAVDYQAILEECAADGIGWLAWQWGPGAEKNDGSACPDFDMTTDHTLATLNTPFAHDVVQGPYGTEATGQVASSVAGPAPAPVPLAPCP